MDVKSTRQDVRAPARSNLLALEAAGTGLCQKYTCSLLMPKDAPRRVGSGTVVLIGDFAVIATAAHVMRGWAPEDIALCGWYDDDTRIPVPRQPATTDGVLDVGALVLSREALGGSRIEGLPLSRIETCISHLDDDPVVLCGTPSSGLRRDQEPTFLSLEYKPLACMTMPIQEWPQHIEDRSADAAKDIFLRYSNEHLFDESGRKTPSTAPFGMSGGGIWRIRLDPGEDIWSPNTATLIGIQSSTKGKTDWPWLRGTQIQWWLRLVWQSYLYLRPAMGAAGFEGP